MEDSNQVLMQDKTVMPFMFQIHLLNNGISVASNSTLSITSKAPTLQNLSELMV
jgi:hypothetical protein